MVGCAKCATMHGGCGGGSAHMVAHMVAQKQGGLND